METSGRWIQVPARSRLSDNKGFLPCPYAVSRSGAPPPSQSNAPRSSPRFPSLACLCVTNHSVKMPS